MHAYSHHHTPINVVFLFSPVPSLLDVATERLESVLKGLNLLLLKEFLEASCFTNSSLSLILKGEHLDLSCTHSGNDVLHILLSILERLFQLSHSLAEYLHLRSFLEGLFAQAWRPERARESRRTRAIVTGVVAHTLKLSIVGITDSGDLFLVTVDPIFRCCLGSNKLVLHRLEANLEGSDTVRVVLAVVVTSNDSVREALSKLCVGCELLLDLRGELSNPTGRVIELIGESAFTLDTLSLGFAHRLVLVSETVNFKLGSIALRDCNGKSVLEALDSKLGLLIRSGLVLEFLDSFKRLGIGGLQLIHFETTKATLYLPLLLKGIFSSAAQNVDLNRPEGRWPRNEPVATELDLARPPPKPPDMARDMRVLLSDGLRNNLITEVVSLAGGLVEFSSDGVDEVLKVVLNNALLRQPPPEVAAGGLEIL
ncbi:hypothetical protein HG531_002153 [Fusarium graminearum]|nr:hypothetical protein HG531_002153 [Fusarium graminearum]